MTESSIMTWYKRGILDSGLCLRGYTGADALGLTTKLCGAEQKFNNTVSQETMVRNLGISPAA